MSSKDTGALFQQEPQVEQILGDVKRIVGVHVKLTQADTNYTPGIDDSPATHDLFVYADTIYVHEDLLLPGRNLALFARRILVKQGVTLNTNGVIAARDFAPGDEPLQLVKGLKDNREGQDGSPGQDGGAGNAAGDVKIVAQLLEVEANKAGEFRELPQGRFSTNALAGELEDILYTPLVDALSIKRKKFSFRFRDNWADFEATARNLNVMPLLIPPKRLLGLRLSHDGRNFTIQASLALSVAFSVSYSLRSDDVPPQARIGFLDYETEYFYYTTPAELELGLELSYSPIDGIIKVVNATASAESLQLRPHQYFGMASDPSIAGRLSNTGTALLIDALRPEVAASLSAAAQSAITAAATELRLLLTTTVNNTEVKTGAATQRPADFRILACGGSGGRGQDGHSGERGGKGDRGRSGIVVTGKVKKGWFPPEAKGGSGFRGGRGGNAGRSGVGGAAGRITLLTNHAADAVVAWATNGGLGGGRSRGGDQGIGGGGGVGAVWKQSHGATSSPTGGYVPSTFSTYTAPDGPAGKPGPKARFAGRMGETGQSQTSDIRSDVAFATFAQHMNLEQLLLIQRHTRNLYLSSNASDEFEKIALTYHWLLHMTEPYAQMLQNSGTEVAGSEEEAEDIRARAAIYFAVLTEAERLERGLDYFGNAFNWAPMFRLTYLSERAQSLINSGRIIEQHYSELVASDNMALDDIENLEQEIQKFNTRLEGVRDSEAALKTAIEAAGLEIDQLAAAIDIQEETVFQQQQRLRKVVIDAQCDLQTIMHVMSAIVSVGSAVLGVMDFVSTSQDLFKDLKKSGMELRPFLKENKKVIKELKKTYKHTIKEFKSIYSNLSDVVDITQPLDSSKILVDRSEFREMIKPYIDEFKDAGDLKNAVETFFDLVDARNQRLLEYNALVFELARRDAEAEQLRSEAYQVRRLKAAALAGRPAESLMLYMNGAYTRVREHLIKTLYEMNRAYQMQAVSHTTLALNSYNIATIADIYESQKLLNQEYLTLVARAPSTISKTVELHRADLPAVFKAFETTGRLEFCIDVDHEAFANYSNVKIEEVELYLPEVKVKTGTLYASIRLSGEQLYRVTDDRTKIESYVPAARTLAFEYNYETENIEARALVYNEAEQYCRLSPFCTWSINFRVRENSNAFLDLADLKVIELRLKGKAFGIR